MVEPGTQRRQKQRARIVPDGERLVQSEADIPPDAARNEAVLGVARHAEEDGEAAPNKRPRVGEETHLSQQCLPSGRDSDTLPDAEPKSEDEESCDELPPTAQKGSTTGVPVPIFVPVKMVPACDVLTGANLKKPQNSSTPANSSDPSSTSWVVRVGEKPKTAEQALLLGAGGPPRTHNNGTLCKFKGVNPFSASNPQPAKPAVSPTNHRPCCLPPRLHLCCPHTTPNMERTLSCHTMLRDSNTWRGQVGYAGALGSTQQAPPPTFASACLPHHPGGKAPPGAPHQPAAAQRSPGTPNAWGAGTAAAALMGTNGAGARPEQRGGAWGRGAAPLEFSSVLAGGMFGMPRAQAAKPPPAKSAKPAQAPAAKVTPHSLRSYLTQSVYKVVLQKSMSARIRRLILFFSDNEG